MYFDQGSGLISIGVWDILWARGVALTWIPSASHCTAGLIENANYLMRYRLTTTHPISFSNIEKNLREGKDIPNVKDDMWDVRLPKVVSSLNHRYMVEIRYSPVEITLGVTSGELLDLEDKYLTTIRTKVLELLRGHVEPVNDDQITEQVHYFMSRRSARTRLAHAENHRI